MGLLDDAIREHLELKRLRGADPGKVAHEEHEALGPVLRDTTVDHTELEDAPSDGGGPPVSELDRSPDPKSSEVGQETVEINMEVELGRDPGDEHGPEVPPNERAAYESDSARAETSAEDSLEWEVPGDRSHESTADTSAVRNTEHPIDKDSELAEHVEDVLEETPDFLRETPEQERLWFEQRPPRDFDFNE